MEPDDLLLLPYAPVVEQTISTSRRVTVHIWVHPKVVTAESYYPKPLSIREWTRMIDNALKPRKPAKGAPKPVLDPDADSMEPVGWTYTWNLR